jgi:hypothetical protein
MMESKGCLTESSFWYFVRERSVGENSYLLNFFRIVETLLETLSETLCEERLSQETLGMGQHILQEMR